MLAHPEELRKVVTQGAVVAIHEDVAGLVRPHFHVELGVPFPGGCVVGQCFLQEGTEGELRGDFGLNAVFLSVFPIQDDAGTLSLEYVGYQLREPMPSQFSAESGPRRGVGLASLLHVGGSGRIYRSDGGGSLQPYGISTLSHGHTRGGSSAA